MSGQGRTSLGREANVGAGTITCNYDGANKHRTVIGDRAFVGSGVELVAPVVVGEGANIGTGSTVTKGAPAGSRWHGCARPSYPAGNALPESPDRAIRSAGSPFAEHAPRFLRKGFQRRRDPGEATTARPPEAPPGFPEHILAARREW